MNRIRLILSVIAILLLFFTGCEKIHRYHYTGKWDFMVVYKSGSLLGWNCDTTYYLGKINIGAAYNKLKVEYLKDSKITLEVDECGGLNKDYESPYEFASGQFFGNNNVEIRLGWMARGGGHSYSIVGTKKEKR